MKRNLDRARRPSRSLASHEPPRRADFGGPSREDRAEVVGRRVIHRIEREWEQVDFIVEEVRRRDG